MSLKKGIMVGVVMTVLVCLLCAPFGAWAEETDKPTGTEITVDLIIARPIGIMSLVAGTAIFVVSYPIAVLTGSVTSNIVADLRGPIRGPELLHSS